MWGNLTSQSIGHQKVQNEGFPNHPYQLTLRLACKAWFLYYFSLTKDAPRKGKAKNNGYCCPFLLFPADQVLSSDECQSPHLGYRGQTDPAGRSRGIWGRSHAETHTHQCHLCLAHLLQLHPPTHQLQHLYSLFLHLLSRESRVIYYWPIMSYCFYF